MDAERERTQPVLSIEFPGDTTAVRSVRRALNQVLPERVDERVVDDVLLVVSELVSNVVLHTDGGGRLEVWDEEPLRFQVVDRDPTPPRINPQPTDHGGRGLHIVDELADMWGVEPADDGKVVWVRFRCPAAYQPSVPSQSHAGMGRSFGTSSGADHR